MKSLNLLLQEPRNDVRVLRAMPSEAQRAVESLGATADPLLRTVALQTGGLLVDHGWLRVLGADTDVAAGLRRWNRSDVHGRGERVVVGHDVVGGFFALTPSSAIHEAQVDYFAPDTLRWEAMELDYGGFIGWALRGDLAGFYGTFRWDGWEADCEAVDGDDGFSIYPFPWAREGGPIGSRSRRVVPMIELWTSQHDLAAQLAALPDGASVNVRLVE